MFDACMIITHAHLWGQLLKLFIYCFDDLFLQFLWWI